MTQYVINIGAIPNDGTGDPLRTAFNETNLNFDQVFAAGPVLSNIQIANNTILTTNTNGNLVLAPNGTGVVQSNVSIVPNLANLRNLGSSTKRWATVYTQYLNATQINLTGDLTVAGNLTVQGNIIQVGNIVTDSLTIQLANTASTANAANGSGITVGANDNIATLLYNSTGNVWTTNIGVSSVGNITAPYLFGNGSQLTGLAATYGNANVATLLAGFGSNTVSTTGNISGGYLFGNGSQLSGIAAPYGNANVAAYLPTFTGNIATGNLTANTVGINGNLWSFTTTGAASGGSYLYSPTGASWYADPNYGDDFIYSGPGGYINIGTLHANSDYASQIHMEQTRTQIILGQGGDEQIWSFNDDGTTQFPGNVIQTPEGNPITVKATNGNAYTRFEAGADYAQIGLQDDTTGAYQAWAYLETDMANVNTPSATVILKPGDTGTEVRWTYNADGSVVFPTLSVDLHNGGNTQGQTLQFGDPNQQAFITGPAPLVEGYAAQRLIIQGQYGNTGEGGDVYIWGGDSQANGGDIKIYAGDADTAGRGGNIHIEGGRGTTDAGEITLIGGRNDDGVGARVDLTGGLGSTGGGNINLTGGYGALTGGNVAITGGISGNGLGYYGNVNISAGASTWTFDNTGNLNLPMGGIVYETNIPDGALSGSAIALKPTGGTNADQQLLIYPTVNDANHLHLTTGNLYNTELFLGDDNLYVKLANTGNVVVNSNDDTGNTAQWIFGANGNLTLPGNIIAINYANGNRVTGGVTFDGEAVIGTGTSNTQSGLYLAPDPVSLTNDLYLRVRGNIIDEPTHIHFDTGNNQYFNQFIGDDNKYIQLANTGNIVINSNDAAGNSAQWIFNTAGTLTLPGGSRIRPLGANLDLFAGGGYVNLITADESSYMGVSGNGGFITTVSGTWQFDTTGNLSAPGNVSAVGNVTGGNIVTAGSAGNITMTGGNITGANVVTANSFVGNGATLSNVATQVTGSWTVPVGNSTQSFTVPINNTYQLWVLGNIPNGIIVYNATVSVSNTNVPVIGQQFAWNYEGGGNILMFNSIPAQIIGTAGAISNAQPAVANTNVFSFGIDNTSGNAVTVNYGYTKIS